MLALRIPRHMQKKKQLYSLYTSWYLSLKNIESIWEYLRLRVFFSLWWLSLWWKHFGESRIMVFAMGNQKLLKLSFKIISKKFIWQNFFKKAKKPYVWSVFYQRWAKANFLQHLSSAWFCRLYKFAATCKKIRKI